MSLIRLRTFVEVYRQRSFIGAARSLNLTQPAVSQHIAGLEVAIGRPLFTRQSHGVYPTLAADELATDIGDKLDLAEVALSAAKARSLDMSGALHLIGHADFMAERVTPELLPLLEAGIRVRMHIGDGPLVTQLLLEEQCDLGFSVHPVSDPRLKSEVVFRDSVLAVASPTVANRLLAADDFAAALLSEPLLAYNLELSLIEDWLTYNRINIDHLMPAAVGQDLRAQRSLLCQGFGWSIMPEYLCLESIATGKLVALPAPVANTQVLYFLIWLPSALRQPRIAYARQTLIWQMKREPIFRGDNG
ncbi:LysR family transcriptional regulator [Celerinatantimonas yamalensis]|uniref:LysR family transcriptional regulator n=1 Tax=Celerinatantimonas yamalensis TaxID=559956 RepID=A0ABW9GB11_9GAMM